MSQDDFEARLKRVQKTQKSMGPPQPIHRPQREESEFDETAFIGKVLLPQLAFVLGAISLIAGRSIAMNQLGIEPSTQTMSLAEGAVVLILLVIIGFVFGKSNYVSHIAMGFGAALAFLTESFYIPLFQGLMEQIYSPEYVALVTLGFE